eukprot:scaffold73255_cov35-Tisochrysis_lutea.AAC.1
MSSLGGWGKLRCTTERGCPRASTSPGHYGAGAAASLSTRASAHELGGSENDRERKQHGLEYQGSRE